MEAETRKQQLTSLETLGKILYRKLLILEGRAVLVIQPAELLKNFGMSGVVSDDTLVRVFSADMLDDD